MRKLMSRFSFFILLLFCCNLVLPGYVTFAGTSSGEGAAFNQDKEISFMPPNPEVYPEFYEKDGDISDIMRASAKYSVPKIERVGGAESIPVGGAIEKVLVIPVYFSDEEFELGHDSVYFENIMLQMQDYFEANSQYNDEEAKGMSIAATVVEAVYSDQTMAYYGEDGSDIDDANGDISELAREAVQKIDATVDFRDYDTNGDGTIDHLFIIHAGIGQEENLDPENELIWSHRWAIAGGEDTDDGITAFNYAMVPETGQLGTFAHEFGHDIGLPDLYDTNDLDYGMTEGVGDWDVMGSGSWNHRDGEDPGTCPANLSAWSRMYLGWAELRTLTQNEGATIYSSDGISQVLKFWTAGDESGNEYYLSEYRIKQGYDEGLPGEGLLIWHIDQQQVNATIAANTLNADENRLGVELEQADGELDLWTMSNRGDAGDPFTGSSWNANFTAVPYSFNYSNIDGEFSYVAVTNIRGAYAEYIIEPDVPDKPHIYLPNNGSNTSTRPTFSWNVSSQAEYYVLQISEDDSFESDVMEFVLSTGEDGLNYLGDAFTFTLPESDELAKDTSYNLRIVGVNSLNNEGNLEWTTEYNFSTIADGMNISEVGTDMPTPRERLATVGLDGKIYAIGGFNENGASSKMEVYDPDTDTWDTLADMLGARADLGAAAVNGKIYAIGGDIGADSVRTVYEYDPASDAWDTKANMLLGVRGFGIAVLEDKIYIVGGVDEDGLLSDQLQIYDPSADAWESRFCGESEFTPRAYLGAAAVNGMLYAIGGCTGEDSFSTDEDNTIYTLSIVEVYNPEDDTWLLADDMPEELSSFGTTVLGDKIYVMGGYSDFFRFSAMIFEYDPIEEYWIEKTSMQAERAYLGAASSGVKIYAVGGSRLQGGAYPYFSTVETYEPEMSPPHIRFSFDGVNAGRLMGITPEMEYSLDGGASYVSAVENNQLLTAAEIASITVENDIRIRVRATESEPAGVRDIIPISVEKALFRVIGDNTHNTIERIDSEMEFSTDGINWVMYNNNLPDLTGNITIYVRYAANDRLLPGPISTFVFTASRPSSGGRGGSGGGGGGGGTSAATPDPSALTMIEAAVIVSRTAANAYLNNEKYENVIVDIPKKATEQSAAIDTTIFSMLSEKGKGLVINGKNLTMVLSSDVLRNEQRNLDGKDTYFKLVTGVLNEQQTKEKADLLKQAANNGLTLTDNNIFEFNAALVTNDMHQRVSSFNAPIRITISLKDSKLGNIDAEKLGVYYYNETTKTWDYIGGKFDAAAKVISFDTTHFSSFAVMSYEKTFQDIAKHWARPYIEKMAAKHIAQGTNSRFEPEASISRAEFTALLVRALELKESKEGTKASYSDITEGKWYAPEINKAYNSGIAKKEDGVNFRPDIAITREEIVVMIARGLQYKGIAGKPSEDQITQRLKQFSDYGQISQSAREPFAIAMEKEIINGRIPTLISPKGSATRAEAIVMIYRLLNLK
ncbi:MAG TPA: M6 family metalloprotease domain-containing protein [Clostridia bacterium]|nr:M6 family metalloprotease domain-containing protein [Clostridia bacterium]